MFKRSFFPNPRKLIFGTDWWTDVDDAYVVMNRDHNWYVERIDALLGRN